MKNWEIQPCGTFHHNLVCKVRLTNIPKWSKLVTWEACHASGSLASLSVVMAIVLFLVLFLRKLMNWERSTSSWPQNSPLLWLTSATWNVTSRDSIQTLPPLVTHHLASNVITDCCCNSRLLTSEVKVQKCMSHVDDHRRCASLLTAHSQLLAEKSQMIQEFTGRLQNKRLALEQSSKWVFIIFSCGTIIHCIIFYPRNASQTYYNIDKRKGEAPHQSNLETACTVSHGSDLGLC